MNSQVAWRVDLWRGHAKDALRTQLLLLGRTLCMVIRPPHNGYRPLLYKQAQNSRLLSQARVRVSARDQLVIMPGMRPACAIGISTLRFSCHPSRPTFSAYYDACALGRGEKGSYILYTRERARERVAALAYLFVQELRCCSVKDKANMRCVCAPSRTGLHDSQNKKD